MLRWVNLAVVILFVLATLTFAAENLETATVSFLSFHLGAPLAMLTIVVYLLGAATGGSLFALLRRAYESSTRT